MLKNLWVHTWVKMLAGALIVLILLFIYSFSGSSTLRLPNTVGMMDNFAYRQDALSFPEQFAGYGETTTSNIGKSLAPVPSDDGGAGTTNAVDAKIIQTGYLTIEVENIETSLDTIATIASKYQGFIISKNFSESTSGYRTGTAQIKVPFEAFADTLADLKRSAVFVGQESTDSTDVTEEYIDLQAQLQNLKVEEQQYQTIMKQAVKIEDILSVAGRLADVRGRIESITGRIKYYDNRTEFSIINVTLTETGVVQAPANKWRPWQDIKNSAQRLIIQLQNFVTNIVSFVFWLIGAIPYLLVLGIIYWLVSKMVRSKKKPPIR